LARVFPELALLAPDLGVGWVLELLDRYPTAAAVAAADAAELRTIHHLPEAKILLLQQRARDSVASLSGPLAEELIRLQVRDVRQARLQHKSLETMLVTAYGQLPKPNHLDTIKGIGTVTVAVLTAKIADIHRFATPGKLVGYFGTFPIQESSGIDRDGKRRPTKRMVMSKCGCDLVRRYLYTAALSAARYNPAVRPLYQRVRAQHPDHPAIAIGHCMKKLLHLVFAVWKTDQPFDPNHFAWERLPKGTPPDAPAASPSHPVVTQQQPPANRTGEALAEQSVLVATGSPPAADGGAPGERTDLPRSQPDPAAGASAPWLDFAYLRSQLSLTQVLEHLGVLPTLRGRGAQRRGPCPVHGPSSKGRTFSVHLEENVFHCFDSQCGIQGDVIDLWAAVKHLPLREAALDLVRTFGLEPAPATRTEKRQG
jgi:hypothetical protein